MAEHCLIALQSMIILICTHCTQGQKWQKQSLCGWARKLNQLPYHVNENYYNNYLEYSA